MSLFAPADRHFAQAISQLAYCNPFLPARIEYERSALGEQFDPRDADWNVNWSAIAAATQNDHPNVRRLIEGCERVLELSQAKVARRSDWAAADFALYENLVLFALYHRHRTGFDELIRDGIARKKIVKVAVYDSLVNDARRYLLFGERVLPLWHELPHLTACLFQVQRAFRNIFDFIIGASRPAVALRAAVWQSIFTHDMRRFRRVLYNRMADYTTLVTGPSGTGKELVARAVGLSRYIPFDAQRRRFTEDFVGSFFPLNLSALSPTLIESELFGHKRGAFTGAVEDRLGWLEICPPQGTVFLDEIGELEPAIQVKLLRVLQERSFSRLGETDERQFHGKLIAATNRDLAAQMQASRFREDLYYRLCSDIIVTPGLRERLADDPAELRELVIHVARRLVGDEAEAVAEEVLAAIGSQLGHDYAWPGNIRELEQCVRNVLVRKEYRPARRLDGQPQAAKQAMLAEIGAGKLTAEQLLQGYCTLVYAQTGSYEATARQIKLDRRTVKAKIDVGLLEKLQ